MTRVPDPPPTAHPSPLLVVTPWYPTDERPYLGTFVRESVRAVAPYVAGVTILHVESRPADSDERPAWSQTADGALVRIPVPLPADTGRGATILAHRRAMAAHAGDLLASASVVHCHVGSPTAGALAPLLSAEARLVVTEHATYLPSVFRDPLARRCYRAALRRAQVVTAVSRQTADLIESSFPLERAVQTVPNPVDLTGLLEPGAGRPRPAVTLERWLYVGNLVPHKGVRRVVRAFAAWYERSARPAARLTLAGDGPLRTELTDLAAALGVGDRVDLPGAVAPDRIGAVYAGHDVLVHLSHVETFGLTCVEAAASGLAVVVTDCGAPTHTLAVHAALGLATVVPVADDEDVGDVVAAVVRLCDGLTARAGTAPSALPERLRLARRHLERCYGSTAVGARLAAVLGMPGPSGVTSRRGGPRLLAVAVTPEHLAAAERALWDAHDLDGTGLLVTTIPPAHPLPPGVPVRRPGLAASAPPGWPVGRLLAPRSHAGVGFLRWRTALWDGLDALARGIARLIPNRRGSQRVLLGLGRRIDRLRSSHAGMGPRAASWVDGPISTAVVAAVGDVLGGVDLGEVDLVQAPASIADELRQVDREGHPPVEVKPLWSRRELADWWVEHRRSD